MSPCYFLFSQSSYVMVSVSRPHTHVHHDDLHCSKHMESHLRGYVLVGHVIQ